jgi:hypothetical protein
MKYLLIGFTVILLVIILSSETENFRTSYTGPIKFQDGNFNNIRVLSHRAPPFLGPAQLENNDVTNWGFRDPDSTRMMLAWQESRPIELMPEPPLPPIF